MLYRLTALAVVLSLAWPAIAASPAEPTGPSRPGTETETACSPDGGVGIDDFIVWVDGMGGGYAEIPVRAALPCAYSRTISFKTYDISARSGQDYVGITSGTVVLTAGATEVKIRIQIFGRVGPSPDVTFGVLLLSGARFYDPEAIVTIKTR